MSLAVAGSLAGAHSAKADPIDCVNCDTSPRSVAIGGVMDKLNGIMGKDDGVFWKLETPLFKLQSVLDKFNPF